MSSPAERDKQPSARYVERLADEVADRIMALEGVIPPSLGEAGRDAMRRQVYWTILEASVEMRRRNVDR